MPRQKKRGRCEDSSAEGEFPVPQGVHRENSCLSAQIWFTCPDASNECAQACSERSSVPCI